MKKSVILSLALSLCLGFSVSNSHAYTAQEMYEICKSDKYDIAKARQSGGNAYDYFKKVNDYLRITNATDKNYSSQELATKYDETLKNADPERGLSYLTEIFQLALKLRVDYSDRICYVLEEQVGIENPNHNYSNKIILTPNMFFKVYSKEAEIESKYNPPNIGYWKSNTPIVVPVYIDKSGTYEVSINYSKAPPRGSVLPFEVYAYDKFSNDIWEFTDDNQFRYKQFPEHELRNAQSFSVNLPQTGKWTSYNKVKIGKFNFEAGKAYLLTFRDKDQGHDKYTMNLRDVVLEIVK